MANILFQWLMIACIHLMHPFFVSMTDINYNGKDKELEVSVRIFADDFENTLRKYHSEKIDILHPADEKQMNDFVFDYIKKNLKLQINGEPVEMSYVGYEQQSESIWTYLEVKNIDKADKVNIVNTLLYDYSNNEINMIHVKVNGAEKTTKLNYPEEKAEFQF